MEHGSCMPQGTEVVQTGFHYTLSLIGGKYKMAILYLLAGLSCGRSTRRCRPRWSMLSRSVGGRLSRSCTACATGASSTGTTRTYDNAATKRA